MYNACSSQPVFFSPSRCSLQSCLLVQRLLTFKIHITHHAIPMTFNLVMLIPPVNTYHPTPAEIKKAKSKEQHLPSIVSEKGGKWNNTYTTMSAQQKSPTPTILCQPKAGSTSSLPVKDGPHLQPADLSHWRHTFRPSLYSYVR